MIINRLKKIFKQGQIIKQGQKILILYALYAVFNLFSQIVTVTPQAEAQEPSRQEIQAAMIIKFTDFIEWPQESFAENSEDFTIAVIGENKYEGIFEPFTKRLFQDKKLKIVYYKDIENIYKDVENIGKVQILIFNISKKKKVKTLLDKLKGKPILTVGDSPEFAEHGGIINFVKKANNKIGFEINIESKDFSGIKISSHLLKLGKIITPE
ncbi:MAG: YfiR family protein [Desulfamplus sp.]|nr:YfiR family protein [Desulfamplus sp.]